MGSVGQIRLGVSQPMQVLFLEAKIVADLVHYGDANLLYEFFLGRAIFFQGFFIDSDRVGEEPGVIKAAFGERHTMVKPEDIRGVLGIILDEDGKVGDVLGDGLRDSG